MAGLLDYIFSSLEIESLEHKQVMEYLCYLQEIIPQVHTIEERIKFSTYHLRLTKRLIDLDRTALRDLSSVLAENRRTIALKKAKYYLV